MIHDGWELFPTQSPLRPGQTGQHTNGPCIWWVRKDGDWERMPWKHQLKAIKFYDKHGRWPQDGDDEYAVENK